MFVLQAAAPWSFFHLWPPFLHHASPFPFHLSLSRAADNTSGRSASGSLTGPLSLCFFPSVAFPQYNGHTCETHRCITNHLVDSRIVRLTCSLSLISDQSLKLHQLLREICGYLATNSSTMFTKLLLHVSAVWSPYTVTILKMFYIFFYIPSWPP